jgi:transcriptional regulator with XRE-family HTH domain
VIKVRIEPLKYERIRSERIDRELTQAQVAQLLHVKQNTYSQYEIGVLNFPLEVVIKLARFYGTSVDYLVGLTDVRQPYPQRR